MHRFRPHYWLRRLVFAAAALAAALPARGGAAPEFTGKRLVEWTGRAVDLRYTTRNAVYYTADEFTFTLDSPTQGKWRVVSREPTPFETFRMGPTFTDVKVDWSKNPEVRVIGVKGIDRIPPTYPGLNLDPERTVTALMLEVRDGAGWKPWYINNWFHAWSTPEENARLARQYVDRPTPYDLYGFKSDLPAELTAKSKALAARFPEWRCYHGRLVKDPAAPSGFALDFLHLFARNAATGGHDCVYGDPKTLVPLKK